MGTQVPNDAKQASRRTSEAIDRWKKTHERHIGHRTADELEVLYLSGPEPLNDYNELVSLGVQPRNIWAVESDNNAYDAAIQQLRSNRTTDMNLINSDVGSFFISCPQTFDIIYLDFTKNIRDHINDLILLFEHRRLHSPGVLITNFCVPPEGAKDDNWLDLISTYLVSKECFVSHDEKQIWPRDEGWDPDEPLLLKRHISENFEHYYSEFTTLLLHDIGAVIVPYKRLYMKSMKKGYHTMARLFDNPRITKVLNDLQSSAKLDVDRQEPVHALESLDETQRSVARFLYQFSKRKIAQFNLLMVDILGPNKIADHHFVVRLMLALEHERYHTDRAMRMTSTPRERFWSGEYTKEDLRQLGLQDFPPEAVAHARACHLAVNTFNSSAEVHLYVEECVAEEEARRARENEAKNKTIEGPDKEAEDKEAEDEEDAEEEDLFGSWFGRQFDDYRNRQPKLSNLADWISKLRTWSEVLKELEAILDALYKVERTAADLQNLHSPAFEQWDTLLDKLLNPVKQGPRSRRQFYQFCDVFQPERVSLDMLLGFLSFPALPVRRLCSRFAYTDKVNRMLVDLTVFDECRYLYGAFPVGELFRDTLDDPDRELCLRFVLDGLRRCLKPFINEWALYGLVKEADLFIHPVRPSLN